jgi:hypothetical protein
MLVHSHPRSSRKMAEESSRERRAILSAHRELAADGPGTTSRVERNREPRIGGVGHGLTAQLTQLVECVAEHISARPVGQHVRPSGAVNRIASMPMSTIHR